MMPPQVHRTLLITPAYREAALQLIVAVAGEGQGGMFQVAVGADETITHYMSTGLIGEPFADILPLKTVVDGVETVRPANLQAIMYLAAQAGFPATQEQIEAVLDNCIVTDREWKETLDDLGKEILQ